MSKVSDDVVSFLKPRFGPLEFGVTGRLSGVQVLEAINNVLAAFVALTALMAKSGESTAVLLAQGISNMVGSANYVWPYRRDPEGYRDG